MANRRIFLDYEPNSRCRNPWDSWGVCCTCCNCCGRYNKKTMYRSRIKTYRALLDQEVNDLGDRKRFPSDEQQQNIMLNIRYFRLLIANAERGERRRETKDGVNEAHKD